MNGGTKLLYVAAVLFVSTGMIAATTASIVFILPLATVIALLAFSLIRDSKKVIALNCLLIIFWCVASMIGNSEVFSRSIILLFSFALIPILLSAITLFITYNNIRKEIHMRVNNTHKSARVVATQIWEFM